MTQARKWVGIDHEGIERETDAAVLFSCQGSKVWIPRSHMDDYDDAMMIVSQWIADEKDLEPDWEP